jgi:hypothetical protein
MNLSKLVRFSRPIGIEYTCQPLIKKLPLSKWGEWWEKYRRYYEAAYEDAGHNADGLGESIACDPACVEHSSGILRTWKQARDFFERATTTAASVGLGWRDDHIGGGGHIHMSKFTAEQAANMLIDAVCRPYLQMACLNACDQHNAKPLLDAVKAVCEPAPYIKSACWHWSRYRTFCRNSQLDMKRWHLTLRPAHRTIEWRAFDAAADWEIQELQIALYQRYADYATQRTTPLDMPTIRHFRRVACDIDASVAGFRHLIEHELELPWLSYSWMVERNLIPNVEVRKNREIT